MQSSWGDFKIKSNLRLLSLFSTSEIFTLKQHCNTAGEVVGFKCRRWRSERRSWWGGTRAKRLSPQTWKPLLHNRPLDDKSPACISSPPLDRWCLTCINPPHSSPLYPPPTLSPSFLSLSLSLRLATQVERMAAHIGGLWWGLCWGPLRGIWTQCRWPAALLKSALRRQRGKKINKKNSVLVQEVI